MKWKLIHERFIYYNRYKPGFRNCDEEWDRSIDRRLEHIASEIRLRRIKGKKKRKMRKAR